MSKTEKSEKLARRDFLKGVGVAGAAGVATSRSIRKDGRGCTARRIARVAVIGKQNMS